MTSLSRVAPPFCLRGVIVHGHGRGGSKLGYPTANAKLDSATVAALEPYNNLVLFGWGCLEPNQPDTTPALKGEAPSCLSFADCGPHPFVMSVGYNPQFKDVALSAEVHFLYTFPCDFYGHVFRVEVLGAIREMSAFSSLQELIDTINNDVLRANEELAKDSMQAHRKDRFVQPDAVLTEAERSLPFFERMAS